MFYTIGVGYRCSVCGRVGKVYFGVNPCDLKVNGEAMLICKHLPDLEFLNLMLQGYAAIICGVRSN